MNLSPETERKSHPSSIKNPILLDQLPPEPSIDRQPQRRPSDTDHTMSGEKSRSGLCQSKACCTFCAIFSMIAVVFLSITGVVMYTQPQFVPELTADSKKYADKTGFNLFLAAGFYTVFGIFAATSAFSKSPPSPTKPNIQEMYEMKSAIEIGAVEKYQDEKTNL